MNATAAALAAAIDDDPAVAEALAHLVGVLGTVEVVTVTETVEETAVADIAPADAPAPSTVIRVDDVRPGDVVRLAHRWMTVDRVADLGMLRYPPTIRLYVHDALGNRFEPEDRPHGEIERRN